MLHLQSPDSISANLPAQSMIFMQHIAMYILTLMLLVSCGQGTAPQAGSSQGRTIELDSALTFLDDDNNPITSIRIAIVESEEERNLGLMDVRSLPPDAGMLFIFDAEAPLGFWMANTPLPLDLIFADSDSTIVHIHSNAVPYSLQNIPSVHPARYVVEVNAGFSVNYDLRPGHRITFNQTNP